MQMTTTSERNRGYTNIRHAAILDNSITLQARGLLAVLLSLPDTWTLSVPGLAAITRASRHKVYSSLQELTDRGYVHRELVRDGSRNAGMLFEVRAQVTDRKPTRTFMSPGVKNRAKKAGAPKAAQGQNREIWVKTHDPENQERDVGRYTFEDCESHDHENQERENIEHLSHSDSHDLDSHDLENQEGIYIKNIYKEEEEEEEETPSTQLRFASSVRSTPRYESPEASAPPLKILREVFPDAFPTLFQIDEILQTVTDMELWREVVRYWGGRGYQSRNIRGMLEFYQTGGPAALQRQRQLQQQPGRPAPPVFADCPICENGMQHACPRHGGRS